VAHGNLWIYLAGSFCLIAVIIAYLIAPGGILIRAAAALASFVTCLVGFGLAWYLHLAPSEPLAAVLSGASLFTGWRFAKFLQRRLWR
jgi:CHASE2 domain-containing sensor protein